MVTVWCKNCGTQNPDDFEYCFECGKPFWHCPHCGKQIAELVNFCGYCGKNLNNVLPRQEAVPKHNSLGKSCPFCQMPFKPGAKIEICPACQIPHHLECWRENGNKCTTYGCTGKLAKTNISDTERSAHAKNSPGVNRSLPEQSKMQTINILADIGGIVNAIYNFQGDRVRVGTTILNLTDARGSTVVSRVVVSPIDGYVQQLMVNKGDRVIQGQVIATVRKSS